MLGTAEMILQMRSDIEDVEEKLGRVGKGCGRAVIGGKVGGLSRLKGGRGEGKREEDLGWAARMKLLDLCGILVWRLLRRDGKEDPGGG